MIPTSIEQILEWSASNGASAPASGTVTHYTLLGASTLYVYPTPAQADTLTVFHVKYPTYLSSDSDKPLIPEPYASTCLVEGACYQAAMFLGDPNATLYKANYDEALRKLRGHLRRREGAMTRQFRFTGADNVIARDPSSDVKVRW